MAAANEYLITRVEVHEIGAHDVVKVWNRGGLAGTLTVTRGDGARVADRLAPEDSIITMKYGIRTWVPMKLGETTEDEEPDLKGYEESNTLCSVCKTQQYITPSGLVCKNGHGGAMPL